MPSLRRSLSSPSVRTAPYSLLSPTAAPRNASGHHRRSMGSETTTRRILADIEWWRVADGQRVEQELEEQDLDPEQEDEILPDQVAVVPVPSQAPQEMPVVEMAALSIAPSTPRRHALESSTSSLESTPEASYVQAEHPLSLDLQDSVVHIARNRSVTLPPLLSLRAHSFADMSTHERQYADFAVSPLSSPAIFSN